jgi:hypothetical protein
VAASVKAGQSQTLTLQHVDPGSTVRATVSYPDGFTQQLSATAASNGSAQIAFLQPAGVFTRHRHTAEVMAEGSSPAGPYHLSRQYTIAFGAIDLTVQPRRPTAGRFITAWVHTAKRAAVTFTIRVTRHTSVFHARTGAQGWAGVRYRLPRSARGSIAVRADARIGHKTLKASSTAVVA